MDLNLKIENEIEIPMDMLVSLGMEMLTMPDQMRNYILNKTNLFLIKRTDGRIQGAFIPKCDCENCQEAAEILKKGIREGLSNSAVESMIDEFMKRDLHDHD